jgi:small subunit ribosomal protein S14
MSTGQEESDDARDEEARQEDAERTGNTHVCRMTARKQGLVGKYDIWLSRQAFREVARDMGFEKYD